MLVVGVAEGRRGGRRRPCPAKSSGSLRESSEKYPNPIINRSYHVIFGHTFLKPRLRAQTFAVGSQLPFPSVTPLGDLRRPPAVCSHVCCGCPLCRGDGTRRVCRGGARGGTEERRGRVHWLCPGSSGSGSCPHGLPGSPGCCSFPQTQVCPCQAKPNTPAVSSSATLPLLSSLVSSHSTPTKHSPSFHHTPSPPPLHTATPC